MLNKLKGSLMVGATALSMGSVLATSAIQSFAAEAPATQDSKVIANVKSGGISLGVNGGDTTTVTDVNLGELTIGQAIPDKTVKGYITITDATGGNGWDTTVQETNYATANKTIALNLGLGSTSVDLDGTAQAIATNGNQLAPTVLDGTVKSTWGTDPQKDAYQANLTWTVTPKVTTA